MSSLKDWGIGSPRVLNSVSQLEKVLWKSEPVPMKVRGSLNIPEIAVPPKPLPLLDHTTLIAEDPPATDQQAFSPTPSDDSGRSTGTALWPSSKYFVHGGPGFSIGILDSTSGTVERLPVPFPTLSLLDNLDATNNFSISEVTSMTLAGEAQLWAGTQAGSLHVFELSPGPRLTKHGYSKLPDPISCLRTDKQVASRDTLMCRKGRTKIGLAKTEILVGSANGNLTVISGDADERGGLLHVNKCPRKVVQLGGGQDCCSIQCISLVSMMSSEDCYWCGCGSRIIILHRSSWKVLAKLDAMIGFPLPQDSPSSSPEDGGGRNGCTGLQVGHLEPTEYGVWSSMEHSPAMVLWDTRHFTPKLKISCFQPRPETPMVNHQAKVTALTYCDDMLFVGTQGGYLLIFNIHYKVRPRTRNSASVTVHSVPSSLPTSPQLPHPSTSKWRKSSEGLDYSLVAATHGCTQSVISIHPIGQQDSLHSSSPQSPLSTPASSPFTVLVIFGSGEMSLGDSSQSRVHLYEIIGGSPLESPLNSPQGTNGGRGSAGSSQSLPVRRCSLHDLESLPELTLLRVTKGSVSYLPLQEKSS